MKICEVQETQTVDIHYRLNAQGFAMHCRVILNVEAFHSARILYSKGKGG